MEEGVNEKLLHEKVPSELRYEIAAIFVDDAFHKRKTEISLSQAGSHNAVKIFFIVHNSWWRRFVWLFILVQLALAFGERSSFNQPIEAFRFLRVLAGVELGCVAVYFLDMALRCVAVGRHRYFRNPWNILKCIVMSIMVIDIVTALIKPDTFRFSRVLRSFILVEKSRTVRGVALNILRTIPQTFPVFVLLAFLILVYSLFGTIIFSHVNPQDPDFTNLLESLVSMFILTTTENFPDVMIPEYQVNTWYALFFISFLAISQLFLMNLVLAVFYEHYSEQTKANLKKELGYRRDSLSKAFLLIKGDDGGITLDTFTTLVSHLKKFKDASESQVRFIYFMLDKDHDECLNVKEFMYMCEVMQFTFEEVEAVDLDAVYTTSALKSAQKFLRNFLFHRGWTIFVHIIILLTTVIAIVEVVMCKGKCEKTYFDVIEIIITSFFFIEICLRVFALGVKNFFQKKWNIFDFILVFSCFFFDVVIFHIFYSVKLEYLFLLRTLLLLRVIASLKRLQVFVASLIQLLPALGCFIAILFSVFYIYAIVGMEVFYGKINSTNPILLDQYYFINFDDFGHALVALYCLMTVNNWNTFMAGYVYATSKWTRLFFMSFYLISVVVVLNVVIAFVIETFVSQHDKTLQSSKVEVERVKGNAIMDEEIKHRIKLAMQRSGSQTVWRVNTKRNLNALFEEMFKEDMDQKSDAE